MQFTWLIDVGARLLAIGGLIGWLHVVCRFVF